METERMELSLGGCAANTAFDLAKLGVNTGISGCVGNDVLADFIVQTLNAAGVDTRGADGAARWYEKAGSAYVQVLRRKTSRGTVAGRRVRPLLLRRRRTKGYIPRLLLLGERGRAGRGRLPSRHAPGKCGPVREPIALPGRIREPDRDGTQC